MKCTVRLRDGVDDERSPHSRDVECAARAGIQGYGSVEIEVSDLRVFTEYRSEIPYRWATLDQVLSNPAVLGVTFRGPWQ